MFVAGSIPEELIPKSDLDIFIVVDGRYRNEFFNNLVAIINPFVKKRKGLTYSFFRGPLKYKNKGLIHFIIYTEEWNNEYGNREQFKHELRETLKNFLKTGKVIMGKSINYLVRDVDFSKRDIKYDNTKVIGEKYKTLKDKGYIKYKKWKKTKKGWKLMRARKYPSEFFKNYLLNYFKKHLSSYN